MMISRCALDDVVAHARECRPRECCGVLVGRGDQITSAIRTRNIAENPTRFVIDPQDHFEARRTARAQGLDVVGFYHSHPHSRAYPSPIDLAEAAYPDAVHLIVGLMDSEPDIRLFRLAAGEAHEMSVVDDDIEGSKNLRM